MSSSSQKCPKEFGGAERDRYKRGKRLGQGSFAEVFACCKCSDERQIFAVKAIDLQALRLRGSGERALRKLQREATILQKIKPHENLVQFVDFVQQENWYLFVLEYVHGGNLGDCIRNRQGKNGGVNPLREDEVRTIFRQLVEALQHLHSEGVIHRDVKLENVLVAQEGTVKKDFKIKLTDFGLSKEVGDGMSAACSTVGSPSYMAPEMLQPSTHDFKADLWSLGILLFVMLSGGRYPFNGDQQAAKVQQHQIEQEVFNLQASEAARSVLLGLLRQCPEERPSLEDLRGHQWLRPPPSPSELPAAATKRRRTARPRLVPGAVLAAEPGGLPGAAAAAASSVASPQGGPDRGMTWVQRLDTAEVCAHIEAETQHEEVQKLMEMGFERVVAENALQAANGNIKAAADFLVDVNNGHTAPSSCGAPTTEGPTDLC